MSIGVYLEYLVDLLFVTLEEILHIEDFIQF